MDDKNDTVICPQCKSKEVIMGKLIRGEQEYGCLTCGFRSRNFYSVSAKEAKKLPDKPKNFDEKIFKMAEVIKKDNRASFSLIQIAEFAMLGIFIVVVLIVLFVLLFFPKL